MKSIKVFILLTIMASQLYFAPDVMAQAGLNDNQALDARYQSIVTISSFTAKGELKGLKKALNDGLAAGLSINEIKEVIVHLYAYCGFPRSIRGLQSFMSVLDERKSKGITDKVGREATPIKDTGSKFERGKKVLEALTGQPQIEARAGYAAFSPEIEVFLKEHLFADIFERDILSYTDRELATVSALVNLGGVEPMMQSHMGIALHLGITESQLKHLLSLIEMNVGKKEAEAGRQVLSNVMNSRRK
ncbi:carboxymuconolactone decarboxylase family protein [Chitinophagaceae bacterium LB-8]|uniref:Carboxymuconolactone decarboxylase family protein n=1 Tax=Paraflavisolibacter caeni TaxID=2982496 RepID=A0A9X2XX97_9BACT|nr:carboxymuconolactone decarboxylase family protein [Paraflavisolibacter caeni]MCU7550441.1 carboxymuconolactone decarboxylase family protein [Paraflavisolibacter caeni]